MHGFLIVSFFFFFLFQYMKFTVRKEEWMWELAPWEKGLCHMAGQGGG